jgi:uncharacterized protein (TIGR03435 family)
MIDRALRNKRWRLLLLLAWITVTTSSIHAQQSTPPAAEQASQNSAAGTKAPAPTAFEVGTIKPAGPSPDGHTHINHPPGGSFSAINITLLALMEWAFDIPAKQILEGPPWLASTRFDIQAKSDPATDTELRSLASNQERERKRHMVQLLLADRYGLKLHQETRVLPAYDLIPAKGGPKLQPSKSSGKTVGVGRTYFHGEGLTATIIAEQISEITGRIVVDKTRLTGRYDLKLQWTPDDAPDTDNAAPTLFTAIQEQLGLKLEPAKEPVPVLIVDHIEQPSAN